MQPLDTNLSAVQARLGDPVTSKEAAVLSVPKVGTQRWRVLNALWRLEDASGVQGYTSEHIQTEDIEGSSALYAIRIDILRRRITDLVQLGWIEKAEWVSLSSRYSGTRLTAWTLTPKARLKMKELTRGT